MLSYVFIDVPKETSTDAKINGTYTNIFFSFIRHPFILSTSILPYTISLKLYFYTSVDSCANATTKGIVPLVGN